MKTPISQLTGQATPSSASGGTEKYSGNLPSPELGFERSWRGAIRLVSSFLPLVLLSMLLGASAFQLVVAVPNWTGVPALEHYRVFHQVTNPGTFFQMLLPITLLALLLALFCNWGPVAATRWRLAGALALTILAGVITFTFHYPRNKILFEDPLTRPAAYYRQVVTEWAAGDYVRIAVIGSAIVLVAMSMIRWSKHDRPLVKDESKMRPGSGPS